MGSGTNRVCNAVFREFPDIMDVRQVGALLGVSTKTVYNLIRGGALDCLKVGRAYRIPKVSIVRYMNIMRS